MDVLEEQAQQKWEPSSVEVIRTVKQKAFGDILVWMTKHTHPLKDKNYRVQNY